jgi:tetratricopeptide (TPR) repeat protein
MLIDQKVLVQENASWHISTQNETLLTELASPMAPPEDTLIDLHYVFPLPRVPDTIQGVLAARVDLLEQTEKRVLQHASIIGRTFWLSALLALASNLSKATIVETLDSLIRHDFIVETEKQVRSPVGYDGVFVFKHVLIRDVVYNNIPRMRRSLEHVQLALWLEEQTKGDVETFAELLAYHYQRALATWSAGFISNAAVTGPTETPMPTARLTRTELRQQAIKYITLAGDQALHSYFTIRAIQAYSDALELLVDSNANAETLAQMHEKLGHAYSQRGTLDEAWQEYRQALQLVKTQPDVTNVRLLSLYNHLAELGARWLSMFNANPDMQEVRSYIDVGLELLERETLNGRHAEFLTYQAFWYVDMQLLSTHTQDRAKFAELALQSGNDARQIAEVLDDTHAMWITLDALAFIYRKQQKHREAHQIQHDRLKLEKTIQNREELFDLYYSLGWIHEAVSDYPTAMKWFGYAWKMAQTMESPALLLNCMLGRMHVWHQWNRWDEAQEVARSILEIIEQFQQNEQWQFEALELLAVLAYRTGQLEEGDRYTRQYKRLLDQCSSPEDTGAVMPFIQLAREDWERAATEFKTLLQRNEPFPSPKILSTLAELLVITGASAEEQRENCERAVQTAEQSGTRSSVAIALRARGRMHLEQHNWQAGEEDLKQSLLKCKELDLPWERGTTLYCLGLLYRRRADALYKDDPQKHTDDRGRAHYHFEKALGFFEALKAVKDAERARLALAQDNQAPV